MSDTCKTNTGPRIEIRKAWSVPALKKTGIEEITATKSKGKSLDGGSYPDFLYCK